MVIYAFKLGTALFTVLSKAFVSYSNVVGLPQNKYYANAIIENTSVLAF